MLEIKPIKKLDQIDELKKQYFEQSTAPLDGMWHFGFVPMSSHFGFYEDDSLVGYCCINGDGYMLQFYLSQAAHTQARELFTLISEQNSSVVGCVNGAFVSTAEPHYLSLCLDNSSSFKVNALMYKQVAPFVSDNRTSLDLKLASLEQLSKFVEFAVNNIGAPAKWLSEYFGNLIRREELWGYWSDGKLLATGECRLFDEHQTKYADLGMIVAESERGQGIATRVLNRLVSLANKRGLIPICSTDGGNLGAQKAIQRAGLEPLNRIIQIEFDRD
ncbi:GNAT family N-acetyltransferase [Photobacterium halotolerans]|uniref:GNAT family N-acetyltransferase n=1 Tax=Photobacterium halotolerans TaxID=265726 RepID=UPI001372DDED|nr:GNAT family N-acetyltransferase [Photobacterium halotolerans]NAX45736.1 GNAT family N-acetyltransferase [Photobacterium halotolerans]